MGFFLVMKAELVRTWIVMRRYWLQTLTGMIIGYGMLFVMAYGYAHRAPAIGAEINKMADPAQTTNFVLGFIIGMFAFSVVGMFTQGLQGMATTGVLEQLCMSPHGLIVNFMAQTFVSSVTTILTSSIMVYFISKTPTIGGTLYWDTIPIVVLLTLTFGDLLGFGFMVGGLVLVFKQVGQVAFIIRLVLFGLAVFASDDILHQPWFFAVPMHMLPVTDAAICIKYVLIKGQITNGQHLSVFQYQSFYWLLASCFVWTCIGLAVFRVMEDHSRSKGTLGTY